MFPVPARNVWSEPYSSDREIYYSVTVHNTTGAPQACSIDNTLLMGMFTDAPSGSVRVAVARFRVPTNLIPRLHAPFPTIPVVAYNPTTSTSWTATILDPATYIADSKGVWSLSTIVNGLGGGLVEAELGTGVMASSSSAVVTTEGGMRLILNSNVAFFIPRDFAIALNIPFTESVATAQIFTNGPFQGKPISSQGFVRIDQSGGAITLNPDVRTVFTGPIKHLNDTHRFIVSSSGISVDGNREGANAARPVLTDVLPDPDTFEVGDPFVYLPQFYRWYTVTQGPPYERINIDITYETKTGQMHPVLMSPGDVWSVLLVFRRV